MKSEDGSDSAVYPFLDATSTPDTVHPCGDPAAAIVFDNGTLTGCSNAKHIFSSTESQTQTYNLEKSSCQPVPTLKTGHRPKNDALFLKLVS